MKIIVLGKYAMILAMCHLYYSIIFHLTFFTKCVFNTCIIAEKLKHDQNIIYIHCEK